MGKMQGVEECKASKFTWLKTTQQLARYGAPLHYSVGLQAGYDSHCHKH